MTTPTSHKPIIHLPQPLPEDKALFVDQCRCLEHMGNKLAGLTSDMQRIAGTDAPLPYDMMTKDYHWIMEALGNWFNNTGGYVPEEDEWMNEVFQRSQEKFAREGQQS